MTQAVDKQKFYPDIYTIAVPREGGGMVEKSLVGETWQHPDYTAIHKKLEKLGPGLSLEFPVDAKFGGPATMDKYYADGTAIMFTEDSAVRTEKIRFPGQEPMVIRVSRMVEVSRFKKDNDTSWAKDPDANPFT